MHLTSTWQTKVRFCAVRFSRRFFVVSHLDVPLFFFFRLIFRNFVFLSSEKTLALATVANLGGSELCEALLPVRHPDVRP